jgi:hypothetical protein
VWQRQIRQSIHEGEMKEIDNLFNNDDIFDGLYEKKIWNKHIPKTIDDEVIYKKEKGRQGRLIKKKKGDN